MSSPAIAAQDLYLRLGQLLETMAVIDKVRPDDETRRWIARALVLVEAAGDFSDFVLLKTAAGQLGVTSLHQGASNRIAQIVHNALARAEASAPISLQGSFIPAGNQHDALVAISKILAEATKKVLLVDPYADGNILTTFAIQAPQGVAIDILADGGSVKPGLKPAVSAWQAQYGIDRLLSARLTPAKSLHDRLIAIDDSTVWIVGQSFNALATRSPTVVTRLDSETAKLKLSAYGSLWAAAAPI